jgi:anti-sigma regulatory factor (Ser/Thr protein kinase)
MVHRIPVKREAPAIARRAVQQDVPPTTDREKLEDAKLVASELVQNVVLHSSLEHDAEFSVRINTSADRIRIEVEDRGSGFSRDELLPASDDPWAGRGLRLVGAIASRWGAERSPRGGTMAWAEIDT